MKRTLAPLAVLVFTLGLAACGGGGEDGGETEATATPSAVTPTASAVLLHREDLKACLDAAGLAPEDTGLFIVGSLGTDVEAIGVRVDVAGIVQLWVFDEDAASERDYLEKTTPEASEVKAIGNVVVVYERLPADAERSQIEGCLAG